MYVSGWDGGKLHFRILMTGDFMGFWSALCNSGRSPWRIFSALKLEDIFKGFNGFNGLEFEAFELREDLDFEGSCPSEISL